jgi:hypothetical protein
MLSSTTIWMSEFLQVPILQAARAALPQGLILCTDIICPAFTDRWKCDFISSLQVPAPLGSHSLPFAPKQYAQESCEADDNVICRASYILRDTCRQPSSRRNLLWLYIYASMTHIYAKDLVLKAWNKIQPYVRESSLHRDSARAIVSPTAGRLTSRDSFSHLIGAFPYARDSKHGNKASIIVEEIL